ncbi:MAG: DUF4249 family protein [Terrimonas sp.]|nr:DUF4249 family protein [Terrimonas sp.]
MKNILLPIMGLLVIISGCREKYEPPLASLANSFLVVEGNIDPVNGQTLIRLTRTFKLDASATLVSESNAQVRVEGDDNSVYSLNSTGNGFYTGGLNLPTMNKYRLHIKTVNGKEYLSEFIQPKITPPVDSVGWRQTNEGVDFYVNAKDPSNATRYYKWDYEETWEIHSYYNADVIYENDSIRYRIPPGENVNVCWKSGVSSNILIANSNRLQEDIISEFPLLRIPKADERLAVRYSILVRQYALEPDAYSFFEIMKKNTEDIGSLFSPQPSELKGNIKCITDPGEYVIGFITLSSVERKRIFINRAEIQDWPFGQDCPTTTTARKKDSIKYYYQVAGLQPYTVDPATNIVFFSSPRCIDCTKRGGTLTKPVFW